MVTEQRAKQDPYMSSPNNSFQIKRHIQIENKEMEKRYFMKMETNKTKTKAWCSTSYTTQNRF